MQLNCWCKLRASDWDPTSGWPKEATVLLLLGGLFEVEVELDGEGDDEEGPGEAWGTDRPGCKGGGGGADVTTPPITPELPPPLPLPKSKRPIPEWSCS